MSDTDAVLLSFAMMITGMKVMLFVYYIINLLFLKWDYLKAQHCCDKLNKWVKPKIIAHVFLTFLLLINEHWWLMLGNIPLGAWFIYELVSVPKGNTGVYDPEEIQNRCQLKNHIRSSVMCLSYYLIFYYVYCYYFLKILLRKTSWEKPDTQMAQFKVKNDTDFID